MNHVLARRLGKLEASVQAEQHRRMQLAMSQLVEAMMPEHRRLLRDWAVRIKAGAAVCAAGHGDTRACERCITQVEPPALVGAICGIVAEHINRGAPIAFPPEVARVYVDRADAVPAIRCADCGYLLPTRRGRLAFGGPCPGCRGIL